MYYHKDLNEKIIGCAIEVHRHLGPGLLESAYEQCLCHELNRNRITFVRQKPVPIEYKGTKLDCGYKLDFLIDSKVVIELKCVERILPIHEAQLLTYLKLSNIKTGLLINFNSDVLRRGIKRLVL